MIDFHLNTEQDHPPSPCGADPPFFPTTTWCFGSSKKPANLYTKALLIILRYASLILCGTLIANGDQTTLHSGWITHTITPGIVWKSQDFPDLYGAPQTVNLLEVDLSIHTLHFIELKGSPTTVSTIGLDHRALAAINGAYFDTKTYHSTTFIKVAGQVLSNANPTEPRQRSAIAIDDTGAIDIIRKPENLPWSKGLPFRHLLASSPVLVTRSKAWNHANHKYGDHRHPRTAAGITAENRMILLTVDGRRKTAAGMSYTELATTMQALGCRSALCLDGGGSTTMWISGRGVVNTPSTRSLITRLPIERPVANAVIVRKR